MDWEEIWGQAKSQMKSRITHENKKEALEILNKLSGFNEEDALTELKNLDDSGKMAKGVKEQLHKIMQTKSKTSHQKDAYYKWLKEDK